MLRTLRCGYCDCWGFSVSCLFVLVVYCAGFSFDTFLTALLVHWVMKIYFLRHAEPNYVFDRVDTGEFPGPELTPAGEAQAKSLVNHFITISFSHVFCSDMLRAKQTILPYAQAMNVNVAYDVRLREVDDVLNGYAQENRFLEGVASQKTRLQSFLTDIKQLPGNATVLVVAHFNTIEWLSTQLGIPVKGSQYAQLSLIKV